MKLELQEGRFELWITSFLFGKPIKMKMLHVEYVENYVDFSYSLSRKTNA
jgi:hypothetical protein